jgi:autotransporter-associated beta strand protein
MKRHKNLISRLLVVTAITAGSSVFAADYTWGGGIGLWSDVSANGWNGGIPVSGDKATIATGSVTADVNNQQQGVDLVIGSGGALSGGANYLYFSGGAITLDSGTINITNSPGEPWGSAGLCSVVTANSGSSVINGGPGAQLCLETGGTTFSGAGDLDVAIALRDSFYASAGIVKAGSGTLTLSGANIFTGNSFIDEGKLDLTGSLKFKLTGTAANFVSGVGQLNLDGPLVTDTTAADLTHGNEWNLIDVNSLVETYGTGFSVAGFTETSAGQWRMQEGARTWTFSESTGSLSLSINPNYATYVFGTRGTSPTGNVQTVWTQSGVTDLPTGPGEGTNHRLNDWGIVDATNRVLVAFDLSRILTDAAGRGVRVSYAKIEIARSGWVASTSWASNSLFTSAAFDPAATTWDNSSGHQETYIGDIGAPGPITMTWDSRFPGPNPWDENFDFIATDVQDDLNHNRTADYLLRVNVGNEWSATIGADDFKMTVEVEFLAGTPFSSWMAGYPAIPVDQRDPEDDPDGDGANNLTEFALKGDPSNGSDNGLFSTLLQDTAAPVGSELTLVIAVRDGATFASGASGIQSATVAADQLTYAIEGSIDLIFPAAAVSHVSVSDTAAGLPDLTGTAWEYHTFRLDASEGLPGKGFLRAKITTPLTSP